MLASCFPALAAIQTDANSEQAPDDDRMSWWREARFGLYIHWGLYAIPAGEWKGQTNHAEWILTTAQIPVSEYERFLQRFNPVKFDADVWVKMAKDAGMKYIVITSKHHDGFCLFDSKYTDYDVMSTPFKRDIMKELADACRREGIKMCWYHSIMDWHHPDYLPRRGWEDRPAEGADFDRYVKHLHNQVEELLTNYGDIGVMWFDGEWEATWNHEYGQALYELCRKLQPNVIVNNRVDKGRGGMAGLTAPGGFLGDFGTPEQEVPQTGLPAVDWESCITMNRHWGFNKFDTDFKSTETLIRMLVDIASKGGNFLLNVGPTAEGEFPQESVERLKAMGEWMDVNGDSIYGTTASPFKSLAWGRCTAKKMGAGTTLYLHVFDWPEDGRLVVPGLGNEPGRAYLLTEPGRSLDVRRTESDIVITVPRNAPDAVCSVIALEISGDPIVYELPEIKAESAILVRPLTVEIATASGALEVRYTLDGRDPTADSTKYERPFEVSESTVVKARAFHRGKPVTAVAEAKFTRVTPAPAVSVRGSFPGLKCDAFSGDWNQLPDFDRLTPKETKVVANFALDPGPPVEYVGRRYTGYVMVPRDDVYVFSLTSDDGARLLIGGNVVVDNDGLHGSAEKRGVMALAAGTHRITVEYFNKTGAAALEVRLAPIGQPLTAIPDSSLAHG